MRRLLGRVLRRVAAWVVAFFPVVAVLFLLLVEPVARRVLVGVAVAALLVLLVLGWFARRDRELGQALRLGCALLVFAVGCGVSLALLLGGGASGWFRAAPDEPGGGARAQTHRALRLWREAASEWLEGLGDWPFLEPAPNPWPTDENQGPRTRTLPGGEYEMFLDQAFRALVIVAPWGEVPGGDVVMKARARWEGISRDGVWGVVCRYQDPTRFYALVVTGQGRAAIWKHTPNGAWALVAWTLAPGRVAPTPASEPQAAYGWTPSPTPTLGPPFSPPIPPRRPSPTEGPPLLQGQARLRAECWEDTLRLYVDDVLAAEAHDATYRGGRVGLWSLAPPSGRYWRVVWQDFDAYVPATP